MTSPRSDGTAAARGVVRLLNTADGRVLCLAGAVDAAAVDSFLRRYGREPAQIDGIDAGSVTSLSAPAVELVLDHLDAAERAGRDLTLRRSPPLDRLLAPRRTAVRWPSSAHRSAGDPLAGTHSPDAGPSGVRRDRPSP